MAQTLEHWIDRLQTEGRYTFPRHEAIPYSGLSAEAVKKALHRLAIGYVPLTTQHISGRCYLSVRLFAQ